MTTANHCLVVSALLDPACFDHSTRNIRLIETHISWVILTGAFAYKIKKPINLGFLDYSTLEKRKLFCHEELRLNRRLSPEIYIDVVPIRGAIDKPRFHGHGDAIEYAVRMREFPQQALLNNLSARGALKREHVDELAGVVADFHGRIDRAPADSDFGTSQAVQEPVMENFRQILPLTRDGETRHRLHALRSWTQNTHENCVDLITQRKDEGFVRECHGDMHLGNMALVDDRIAIFDGIEFNEHLRWIHVKSEIAFLCMDFEHRQLADYAWRFLNSYLERTGDYGGLSLLRYFQCYRAMVRAKVTRIRLAQPDLKSDERPAVERDFYEYLEQAEGYTQARVPRLIIMHGLSGSGKTTISQVLLEHLGAIRVRSDIERKRLFAMAAGARSGSPLADGIYTPRATERTYSRLLELAETVLQAGFPVIVDATFLRREQRDPFRTMAERLGVSFAILDVDADEGTLTKRISARQKVGRDASEADLAVLQLQSRTYSPLEKDEHALTVRVNGEAKPDPGTLLKALPD